MDFLFLSLLIFHQYRWNNTDIQYLITHFFHSADNTETWLLPQILNNEIIPAGYQIFRRDRINGIGGGILLAISNSLPSHSYICSQRSEFLLVQTERTPPPFFVVMLILPLKALLLCTMIFLHPCHLSAMKIQYFYLVTLTNLIYHGTLCPRHLLLVLLSATNYSI